MNWIGHWPQSWSLSARITLSTILFSSLLTLMMSALQLYMEYQRDHNTILSQFDQIGQGHLPSLTETVWVADRAIIESQLRGFLHGDIEALTVMDHGNIAWSVGEARSAETLQAEFQLLKHYHGQTQLLGTLQVTASLSNIHQRLIDKALFILLSNGIKTALVALFMLALFRRLVIRHLHHMARYTSEMALDHERAPLVLEDKIDHTDAMDTLVGAINLMRTNLGESYRCLRESENRNNILLQTSTDGIYGVDRDGRATFMNQAALDMYGYTEQELIGQQNHQRVHHSYANGSPYPRSRCRIRESMQYGKTVAVSDEWFWRKDGSGFPVEYTSAPIMRDGHVEGAVVIFRDVTIQRRLDTLLYTVAAGVSSEVGEAFFDSLVRSLADALNGDLAYLGIVNGSRTQMDVHTVYHHSGTTEPFSYPIAGTPCERVLQSHAPIYSDTLQADYPQATKLRQCGADHYIATPLSNLDGETIGVLVVVSEQPLPHISQTLSLLEIFGTRASVELQRMASEQDLKLAAIAFETNEAIMITDAQGIILRVNQAFMNTTGFSGAEVIGENPSIMKSGRHDADFYQQMWSTLGSEGHWQGEVWNRRKSGEIYPLWQHVTSVRDDSGRISHYVSTFMDITDRKLAEERIHQIAFYDSLTGLPNRAMLFDRIQQALRTARVEKHYGALLLFDVDDFKNINDAVGHQTGDRLLMTYAERVIEYLGERDTLARIGADEFGVLLPNLAGNRESAARAAQGYMERIRAVLNEPLLLNDLSLIATPSCGVTLFPAGGNDAAAVFMEADTALHRAKQGGRNGSRFFQPEMQEMADRKINMLSIMHQALDKSEFCIFFQPQVDGRGHIVSAEALIRWQHPLQGLISPAEFIPLAEESGQIIELGYWVLQESCNIMQAWINKGLADALHHVAVNISPLQFHQPDFVDQVKHIILDSGINPHFLELEFTEGLLAINVDDVIAKMNELKRIGVSFSIDDFGTGYSSMSYLKRLPVNKIKIDQSFIRDVDTNPQDAAIVESIIAMSRGLGFSLVAEGVETLEAFESLRDHGCEVYQGYYFSRPLRADEFIKLLQLQGSNGSL